MPTTAVNHLVDQPRIRVPVRHGGQALEGDCVSLDDNDMDLPVRNGGSGNGKNLYLWSELVRHLPAVRADDAALGFDLYELVSYAHRESAHEVEQHFPDAFAVPLPLTMAVRGMSREELKSVARLHGIPLGRSTSKQSLLLKIDDHAACMQCTSLVAYLVPMPNSLNALVGSYRQEYTDEQVKSLKNFSLFDLDSETTVPAETHPYLQGGAKLSSLCPLKDFPGECISDDSDRLICNPAPWMLLVRKGGRSFAHYVAKLHGVFVRSRASKAEIIEKLVNHRCVGCTVFVATFVSAVAKPRATRAHKATPKAVPTSPPPEKLHRYPPTPQGLNSKLDIIRDFVSDLHPTCFEEDGCTVCGQLTQLTYLKPLPSDPKLLNPLLELNLVRLERQKDSDLIQYSKEPVRIPTLKSVCPTCLDALEKGRRPVNALANGLWVGSVPAALQGLSYAEQCLIARVRSNRCVVRVSSGQKKMMANAISFPCPTVKVYQLLPPPKKDLEEVLAFIFTGVNPPTEQDLERTPMLVRRNVVARALEWLRLNHADYHDLVIDRTALLTYPISGVPVQVVFRPAEDGSNVVTASTSIHDDGDEEGNETGACPFKVNGLIGENLESMSTAARRALALEHIRSGGHVLAVGHSEKPESIYDNPQLYPQMYPWLFPYGSGGIGNARLWGLVSESKQKRLLLMFHDKRFQLDSRFVLVAFNHEQIKEGTTRSFIFAKRSNFNKIVTDLKRVNPAVIRSISARLRDGERVVPTTEEEKLCYSLMDQIDHVGGSISGSLASKKHMRNELWSLIVYRGAPSWFVTLSPVDHKHPLCLYWADRDIKFTPQIRDYNDRIRLIANNPVAGARFFNYMVQLFIKHVLRWKGDSSSSGLYGSTSAFYGTVEQQGRMTLHLHMLIWVAGSLNPQDVRDRLVSEDGDFQRELVAYLEGCQQGEFMTGNLEDIQKQHLADKDAGIPEPAQVLPTPPPSTNCQDFQLCDCATCVKVKQWYDQFKARVDRVIVTSNVHSCFVKRDVVSNGIHKQHITGKGCINKEGVCTARFPRPVIPETIVDESGHITMKKLEEWINMVTHEVCYLFGCNTDTTSLSSGTAVKATAGYIADYIVKMGLKTHQIFSHIYDVFERHSKLWAEAKSDSEATRKLILKMANTLTSKIEIGAPMAAMYLLNHPDHYSSHTFVPLYWRQFVTEVLREWAAATIDHDTSFSRPTVTTETTFKVPESNDPEEDDDEPRGAGNSLQEELAAFDDTVKIGKSQGKFVSQSSLDDYRYRPDELDNVCLYEWSQCSVRKLLSQAKKDQSNVLRYNPGHPLYETHGVVYDAKRVEYVVPNLLGGYLPRHDADDQDYYCCAMLTFFHPWRSGLDLKSLGETWATAFELHNFTDRHARLIKNMAIRYECYDARDDFHAQIKARTAAQPGPDVDGLEEPDVMDDEEENNEGINEDLLLDDETGEWTLGKNSQMADAEGAMYAAGWVANEGRRNSTVNTTFQPEKNLSATKWRDLVAKEREKVLAGRNNTTMPEDLDWDMEGVGPRVINDARIIPGSHLQHNFRIDDQDINDVKDHVLRLFKLNSEQKKAFLIVANHSVSVNPEPLKMYLGGMGGTGKTRVIEALKYWFRLRGESHRMVVLAPTGAAASIINGSTFHSFLGVVTSEGNGGFAGTSPNLADARLRMAGVDYIFLDEISMVACQHFHLIDARLKDITGILDVPFGGINMIVAGDFAQLPPAGGNALYSGRVAQTQQNRQTLKEQQDTLGLLLWQQFVTVVILKENMRQKSQKPEDQKLRTALENMRFRACTSDDIAFLRSLIPQYNPALNISDKKWRDVSVITAWNAHKDQINEMNAKKYALENNLQLQYFYCIDRQGETGRRAQKPKATRTDTASVRLSPAVQKALWSQPPFTSEHNAACLPLCLGMPVMIRFNVATELCITKGQEATVVGWVSHELPNFPGYRCLDVLFVQLMNPPKLVQLPHLPVNVVPLTKRASPITATLPNDQTISVSRHQVPILLNFAMTDYASQGKTREVNVVDIVNSKNHQSVYTALSRGKRADSTLIIRDFPITKVSGQMNGHLRAEYRALDTLDEITDLHYRGVLPGGVIQRLRESTIAGYKTLQAIKGIPSIPVEGASANNPRKRTRDTYPERPSKRPRSAPMNSTSASLCNGILVRTWTWDATDWSCACDSLLTALLGTWVEDPSYWSQQLESYSLVMQHVMLDFKALRSSSAYLDNVRSNLRTHMWSTDLQSFPRGPHGTDLLDLVQFLFGVRPEDANTLSSELCTDCGFQSEGGAFEAIGRYIVVYEESQVRGSIQEYLNDKESDERECPVCVGKSYLENTYEPLIAIQLPYAVGPAENATEISPVLKLRNTTYRLKSVIYGSIQQYHFTARLVDRKNEVYRYDDMVHGGRLELEGMLTPASSLSWLSSMEGKPAVVVTYARVAG